MIGCALFLIRCISTHYSRMIGIAWCVIRVLWRLDNRLLATGAWPCQCDHQGVRSHNNQPVVR